MPFSWCAECSPNALGVLGLGGLGTATCRGRSSPSSARLHGRSAWAFHPDVVVMIAILVLGGALTNCSAEFTGGNVQQGGPRGRYRTCCEPRLAGETSNRLWHGEGVGRFRVLLPLLSRGSRMDDRRARSVLALRDVEAIRRHARMIWTLPERSSPWSETRQLQARRATASAPVFKNPSRGGTGYHLLSNAVEAVARIIGGGGRAILFGMTTAQIGRRGRAQKIPRCV